MHILETSTYATWLEALGWTIVHAFWQIALLGGMAALIMAWSRQGSARFRFGVLKAAVLGILVWSGSTFMGQFMRLSPVSNAQAPPEFILRLRPLAAPTEKSSLAIFTEWLSGHLTLLVILWSIGFALLLLRILGGAAWIVALRRWRSTAAPVEWLDRFARLRREVGVSSRIKLLSSSHIRTPMVVGWLRPVVVVPASLWTGLEPRHLEALLLHELAHIARRDHWWNVLLIAVETLFYYHPVVWWLAAVWRTEQEHQCDDEVVRVGEAPLVYAKALYHLQAICGSSPSLVLPAAGRKNQLLQRIQRILQSPSKRNHPMEKIIITFLVAGSFGLLSFMEDRTTTSQTELFSERKAEVNVLSQKMVGAEAPLLTNELRKEDVIVRSLRKKNDIPLQQDTLPQERTRLTWKENGKSMKVEIKNGQIQYLEVEGKTIPASDYAKYQDEVEKMIGETPTPPAPPAPPTPPAPGLVPAPPAPPAPPAVRYYGLDSIPNLDSERLQKLERALQERMRAMEVKTRAFEKQMQLLEQEMQRNMNKEERALRETMEQLEQTMRKLSKNGETAQLDEELQQELRQKTQQIAETMQLRAEEVQRKIEKLMKEKELFERQELEEMQRMLRKVQ